MNLYQDLRYALRMLLKDPWFTTVAAVALGLGIGVNTTVFTFVNAVLIRGLPFERPDEIVFLATRDTTGRDSDDGSPASWQEFEDWRAKARSFSGLAAFRPLQMNVSDPEHPAERASGAAVSANAFALLGQQPFLGRDFAPGEDAAGAPPVVVIGYSIWKNRYNSDPGAIGRTLKINEVAYSIIGVMPEGMRFPTNADMWRPLLPPTAESRHNRNVSVFGRLTPGVSWTQASAAMATISRELQTAYPEQNKNIEAWLMTFNERFNGGPIRLVFLSLLGAVGFVLLIACANVANLLLARSAYRAREMAVRTALGASRGRIVRQLLIESVMLASIGGLLGLALTSVGIRLFDAAVADVGKPYWIVFDLDLTVFGCFAVICLATGIVFGLAPALQVSKTNLNDLMKEGGRGQSGGVRARWLTSTLVVGELALTLALLTGAGLMARSFLKLYSLDLGFETAHVLTLRTQLVESKYPKPEQRQIFFDALQRRIRALPGVTNAALASSLPLGGTGQFKFEIEGQPVSDGPRRPRVSVVDAGPGYFETLGVTLQRGRAFSETDGTPGSEVIVINRRLATEFFATVEPLGRRIRLMQGPKEDQPGPWLTIVGVSPTIRQGEVQALEPAAVLYKPSRMSASLDSAMIVRTVAGPESMMAAVREAAKALDQDQPLFGVRTLDEALARSRWQYAVFGSIFVILAVLALVLSSVGIYAITSYSVTQRTQELGLRLALGAQASQISWLILRTGLWQLGIGLTLGLAAAYGVSQVLKSLVAQIPAVDPVTFIAITVLLTIVMLTACLIPARRATRMDPLAALRVD
jgi:putative ABC transport system permease protein